MVHVLVSQLTLLDLHVPEEPTNTVEPVLVGIYLGQKPGPGGTYSIDNPKVKESLHTYIHTYEYSEVLTIV